MTAHLPAAQRVRGSDRRRRGLPSAPRPTFCRMRAKVAPRHITRSSSTPGHAIAAWYAEGERELRAVESGAALLAAAQRLNAELLPGPAVLLVRNAHGAAIAAACSILRLPHETT